MLAVALAMLLGGPTLPLDVKPWPIGVGPAYRLRPAPAAVLAGQPVQRFRCEPRHEQRFGVHLELFAHRKVVIVPAGIGVARPFTSRLGRVAPGRCTYLLRTLDWTGVIEVRPRTFATLGDVFALWGQRLDGHTLARFRTRAPVLAFVDGRRWRADPRMIPLTRHAQIVLEIGGYVRPHPRYLFVNGL